MNHLKKVIWTEGTLLGPQHFQQNDKYYEHQQRLNMQCGFSFHWGVVNMELEDSYLPQRQFILKKCQALFQDGRWVDFDAFGEDGLSLQIPEDAPQELDIYLTLSQNPTVSGISGYPQVNQSTAFNGGYEMVADQYDKSREREVLLARQNLKLVLGRADMTGQTFLKIAHLKYDYSVQSYKLSKNFYFPSLRLSANQNLMHWLSLFVLQIKNDREQLANHKNQKLCMATQFNSHMEIYTQLNRTLSRSLFQLHAMVQTALVHPFEVYQCLAGLIGELTSYTSSYELSFPAYEHWKISEVFQAIQSIYTHLLDAVKPVEIKKITLSEVAGFGFVSDKISQENLNQKLICLSLDHQGVENELIVNLISQIKVAAPSKIENIVHSFTPGVGLKHIKSPIENSNVQENVHYFQLEKNSPGWAHILSEGQISIFLGRELAHLPIQLIIY